MNKKYRIAQIGTFDVENYGDLLFPTVLQYYFPEYEIDLFSPAGGGKKLQDQKNVYAIKDLEHKYLKRKYDAFIIGGGNIIRTDSLIANSYQKDVRLSLELWLYPLIIGQKYNIPVLFNTPGVLHKFKKVEKDFIKTILNNAAYISVRDENSKELLLECNVNNIKVVPDTVLCINQIISKEETINIKKKLENNKKIPKIENYIVIQHNVINSENENYINEMKKLMHIIIDEYKYNIVLLPIGYVHRDTEFLNRLYEDKNEHIKYITNKLKPFEILSVLANSCGYIGTSMHGAITSYAYGKPILMINDDKMIKRNGLVKIINKECIEVNSIEKIIDIFQKHFFDKEVQKSKENIDKQIEIHFKKMKKLIENNHKSNNNDVILALLKTLYDTIDKTIDDSNDRVFIYLDYGNGFSEDTKIEVKNEGNENEIKFNLDIPNNVKQIRIDPFERLIMKIDNLQIKSGKNDLNFTIPNLYLDHYILSDDPNIYVDIDTNINFITVSMNAEVVSYKELASLVNRIYYK